MAGTLSLKDLLIKQRILLKMRNRFADVVLSLGLLSFFYVGSQLGGEGS